MKEAWQSRTIGGPQGTFSHFYCLDKHWCIVELPWHDENHDGISDPNISCIPAGTYTCIWRIGTSKGDCYEITKVPGRDGVLYHVANYGGDKAKGYATDLLGCMGPGEEIKKMYPDTRKYTWVKKGTAQLGVINSGLALIEFNKFFNKESFILHIEEKFVAA